MSVVRMMNYDLTYVLEHYKSIAEFFIISVTNTQMIIVNLANSTHNI
jgi:hypothetical protein